jgi:hypothetical protein
MTPEDGYLPVQAPRPELRGRALLASIDVVIVINGSLVGPDTSAREIEALCVYAQMLPPAVRVALSAALADASAPFPLGAA